MQNTVFQDAFEAGSFRVPLSWVLAGVLVGLLAAFIYFPPALVNEAPFHDDKAYINNALIASGRIRPEDAIGPYAEERPPLFWWLLTGLFILGAPNDSVRWASPLATTLGVVGIYFLAARLFNDFRAGLLAAIFISVSDFFTLTTSYILTDSMGSVLAMLAILSFSLGLRDGVFMWLAGPLTALSIIARDQNLLIVPVILLSLIWVSRLGLGRKLLLFILLAISVSPVILLSQERALQLVSDIITPIFKDQPYLYILGAYLGLSAMIVYKVAEQRNLISRRVNVGERIFDIGLALGLALLVLHPFFMDNVRLGDTFQIAGKGILSRPIAHAIMARELGIGAELPYFERVFIWASQSLKLATLPLLILSLFGALHMLRRGVKIGRPLILWGFLSLAYVILFTHLEYRFLAQAIPPLAILAAYAVAQLWRTSRIFPAILIPLTLLYLFLPPHPYLPLPSLTQPTTIQGLIALTSGNTDGGWLTQYLTYLENIPPAGGLAINPIYPVLGLTTIPLLIISILIGIRRIIIT
jgi:4-amino-4-deoxy-L-arabinose transferase-like glycosyltransferase